MGAVTSPAPLLVWCTASSAAAEALAPPLTKAGWQIEVRAPSAFEIGSTQILLLDDGGDSDAGVALVREQRVRLGDGYVPIIYLAEHESVGLRKRGLEAGADLVLPRGIDPADLLAQLQSLYRLKQRHDALAARAAEASRATQKLQAAYQQINSELEFASRIQASFLPQSLPVLPQVRFAVEYRPVGHVGGDFYDAFRLDEHHIGFYVADAMGHGVGASLLTIFVKKGVRAKEIVGQTYRLVPPNEVLHRLNHDFIDQALQDTPFITMLYGLFNFRDGLLQFSRAGHPYPLYVPREGPVQLWQMEGSLLGVFATEYRLRAQQLQAGDKVLFYTDAIDAAGFGEHAIGLPSLLAAAEQYRALPIAEFVQRLAMDLFVSTKQADDLTLFGMEIPV